MLRSQTGSAPNRAANKSGIKGSAQSLQQFRVLLTQSQQLEQGIDCHDLVAGMGIQFFCGHTGSGLFRFAIRSGIAVMNRVCQQMTVCIQ